MPYGFNDLLSLARQQGFDEDKAKIAAAIAMAESSGRPEITNKNRNGTLDNGLWQINSIHNGEYKGLPASAATDPQIAAGWAKSLFDRAGGSFRDWVAYNSGAYKKYLPGGASAPTAAPASANGPLPAFLRPEFQTPPVDPSTGTMAYSAPPGLINSQPTAGAYGTGQLYQPTSSETAPAEHNDNGGFGRFATGLSSALQSSRKALGGEGGSAPSNPLQAPQWMTLPTPDPTAFVQMQQQRIQNALAQLRQQGIA